MLHARHVDARNLDGALAQANRQLRKLVDDGRIDVHGRMDVLDCGGCTVARLICAEAIAAMSPTGNLQVKQLPQDGIAARW